MSLESNDFYDIAEELLEYFAFLNTLENDYALSCEDGFTGGIFPVRQKIKDILAAAAVGASNEADGLNFVNIRRFCLRNPQSSCRNLIFAPHRRV